MASNKTKYKRFLYYIKKSGHYNGLSQETYTKLTNNPCYYCNDHISDRDGIRLDRIDSNKGYVLNNVVPCCKRCNVAKNDMTIVQYIEWLNRAHETMSIRLSELGYY